MHNKSVQFSSVNTVHEVPEKCVHFSNNVKVHEVPVIDDGSNMICLDSSVLEVSRSLQYRSGRAEDICGLDEQRRKKILEALEAVLDEQVEQWCAGVKNPEKIALLYKKFSVSSQALAIECGLKNHMEVGRRLRGL